MPQAKKTSSEVEKAREEGREVPIGAAADGGDSRLTAGYKDNPDKPDPSSVAQVEVLKDDEGS
jgi:hypothetical protein